MRSEVQVLLDPPLNRGALAQLGERLICIQEVRSSILLGSTILDRITKRITDAFGRPVGRIVGNSDVFNIVKRDTINLLWFARVSADLRVLVRSSGIPRVSERQQPRKRSNVVQVKYTNPVPRKRHEMVPPHDIGGSGIVCF